MIPATLTLGDTWTFRVSISDFPPAEGRSVVCQFAGPSPFAISATADGDGWVFRREHDAPGPPSDGRYNAVIRSTSETGNVTSRMGKTVKILPDPALFAATDARSAAERMLENVEAALTSLLSGTKASVSFGDQSFTQADAEKLMKIRDRLRTEVAQAAGGRRKTIKVRFG
jgi:hypothetical protein